MAELLVRLIDKINEESLYLDCHCTKRGDVIVACPDGWPWGICELNDPQYCVIKIPDLPLDEAQALTASDIDFGAPTGSKTALFRAFHLQLDHPTAAPLLAAMATVHPEQRAIVSSLTADEIRQLKRKRPPVPDPAVFGQPPHIIG